MKEPIKLSPFKHLCMTIGNLPSSYVDSMSYYECLLWLINYLQKTVIPAINNNAEAVKEIQDWIKNLDLQDEVDSKLDEMAESGQLQEIISEYLNSTAIFGFDSVKDMKSANNLIDGSYAKTLGYYEENDNGGALYKIRKITNEDIIDEGSIIPLNNDNLIAELIEKDINVKMFGAKGDGITDDSECFNKAIQFLNESNTLLIPNGTYIINNTITINDSISLKGMNCVPTLRYIGTGTCIKITGHSKVHENNLGTEFANADDKPIIEKINLYHPVDTYYTTDDSIAISCENTNDEIISRSTITKDVTITLFNIGIKFADKNFYINNFIDTKLTRNKKAVYMPQNVVNSGEKISFINCIFGVNEIACEVNQPWYVTFENCSMDFNTCLFYQTSSNAIDTYRKITVSNCHIENNTNNYDLTGTIHGLIYNATGFFTFSNTVFFLTFKEDYFIKDGNTKYTDVSITNCKVQFNATNYNSEYKLVDHDYLCNRYFLLHEENNSYGAVNLPGSAEKIVSYAPYLSTVNEITAGDATIDNTSRCIKDINGKNTHIQVLYGSEVNLSGIKINNAPTNREYMPIEFITNDTSKVSNVQIRDEYFTQMNGNEQYCKYLITENCSLVQVKFEYYDQDKNLIYGEPWTSMPNDNNIPSNTLCRWCYPLAQYKNRLRKQIYYVKMVTRLTSIIGQNMKVHAQFIYTR